MENIPRFIRMEIQLPLITEVSQGCWTEFSYRCMQPWGHLSWGSESYTPISQHQCACPLTGSRDSKMTSSLITINLNVFSETALSKFLTSKDLFFPYRTEYQGVGIWCVVFSGWKVMTFYKPTVSIMPKTSGTLPSGAAWILSMEIMEVMTRRWREIPVLHSVRYWLGGLGC